ncbi:MAG TPA: chemotaxis protein CheW [Candidatus Dormibacteraeota bacterium]|nr:chemotaxis protein CheW [Candidatus Dormibacteraeota bacterium]
MSDERSGRPERERSLREFVAEADEILEALSDAVRDLEAVFEAGRPHLDLINTLFRGAHTLKGFAGLLGFPEIASLTHALEDLLTRLRLGGSLDGAILDLLHDTLDSLLGAVRDLRSGSAAFSGLGPLTDRLARAAAAIIIPQDDRPGTTGLPERIRASLTEYEERRLRQCLSQGFHLALVRVRPDPQSLEEDLQNVARRVGEVGELISTLPVVGERDERIAFDLLVASPRLLSDDDLPRTIVEDRRVVSGPSSAATGEAASPDGSAPGTEAAADRRGATQSLRVPVARLDGVLSQVDALSIALASLEREIAAVREAHPDDHSTRQMGPLLRIVLARLRALQRGAIEARLVPLDQEFRKVGRAVARAARASGKEIDLHTLGADTEIDKSVMDGLATPLMHLVVNAIDHGIESPEERERRRKPRRGQLVLSAFRRGPSVVIDVIDDGRGIAIREIEAAAAARGLWPADREMSREEAHEMIFRPAFSTASHVSTVSGRGVGMDVVRRAIRALKGSIVVRSAEGRGTTFTVMVPISLSLVPAIIVRSGDQRFAIPIASIRENLRLDGTRVRESEGGLLYERQDGQLPLLRLDRLLSGAGGGATDRATLGRYAIVAGGEGRKFGIVVDGLVRRQEVVVKPIGRFLGDLPGVAGAADLGDATAVLVLDPETLMSGDQNADVDA